jgi:hypothetical protein
VTSLSLLPDRLVAVARTHWFGEDVGSIETTLEAASSLMPTFDRRPFGANRFHDVIGAGRPAAWDPLGSRRPASTAGRCSHSRKLRLIAGS